MRDRGPAYVPTSIALLAGLAITGLITVLSYRLDARLLFYDGLVGSLALLCLAKIRWRNSGFVHFAANTLILFIVVLPPLDWLCALAARRTNGGAHSRVGPAAYSFDAAKADPRKFQAWWRHFLAEWERLSREITVRDPDRKLPYILKPGAAGRFFDSEISVNRLGFRDDEFEIEKKNSYRIVAIGESTTMGLTLTKQERPWPKLLGDLIQKELDCPRPVELINAGVAGYHIQHGVVRLEREILRLKPDMILCYYGYNGFHFLDETLETVGARVTQAPPPKFVARPIFLLAHAEHRWRLWFYRRRHFHKELTAEALGRLTDHLLSSPLAQQYQRLISICRAHDIKLVLLSHNLAVNARSSEEVVRFYEGGFPHTRYCIQANALQTALLDQLAAQHPDVLYVNTAKDLDGEHRHYIDLVHLNEQGNDRLARNVYQGIRSWLTSDPNLNCRPGAAASGYRQEK